MTLTGKTEEQNFKDKPFLLYFDVQKKDIPTFTRKVFRGIKGCELHGCFGVQSQSEQLP